MGNKLAIFVCLLSWAVTSAANATPIIIGGYSFSSSADSAVATPGSSYLVNGISTLAINLTDLDPTTWVTAIHAPDLSVRPLTVTLGFSSGIQNLSGNDLVLFGLNNAPFDTFKVTLNGNTQSILAPFPVASFPPFGLLLAAPIDLSTFGLGPGATIYSVPIDLTVPGYIFPGTCCGTLSRLSFAGVLHSGTIPEPITLSLFGAGLVGIAASRRRKKT